METFQHYPAAHVNEGKQSQNYIQPSQSQEDTVKISCIVKDGKLRNTSCSCVGSQWSMQCSPLAGGFGTSGDELQERSPWKMLKLALGIAHLQQWRWFSYKTWTIWIPSPISNILMAAQGTWGQTHCFALKLPYFRHWFAISWLRFPLIPFDLQVQLYQWLVYCQINCPAPKLSSGIGVMHLKHTINLVLQCSERWYVTENTSWWQRYLRPFPLKMHWWCQLGEGRQNVKKKHNLPLPEAGGWKYGDYRDV